VRVLTAPGTGYAYMSFNVRSGPLADPRVRRAICHAVELPPVIEHKFHGLAAPATSLLPKNHWAYAPTAGCPHDPKKTAELLDAAGFPDPDGDGPLPRLELTLKTSTDRFRKSIALVFHEQFARAGIKLEVRSLEFGTFLSDIRKGNFEVATLKFPAVIEPDLFRYVFSSEQIPTPQNNFGGLNRTGFSDPALDRTLQRATEVPGDARIPLYAEVQQTLDDELPFVSLWHEDAISVASERLQDYQSSPHGFFAPLGTAREVDSKP
jgi:peptide/nickel transport system substrate-binding protein